MRTNPVCIGVSIPYPWQLDMYKNLIQMYLFFIESGILDIFKIEDYLTKRY